MVERHTTSKKGETRCFKKDSWITQPWTPEFGHSRFGHFDSLSEAFVHYHVYLLHVECTWHFLDSDVRSVREVRRR
jgi:hypothetical protein